MNQTNKSYEASKWYIKILRHVWYLYAIILHIKNLLNVEFWIDSIFNDQYLSADKKKLNSSWKEIVRHVELSKMHKYTSRYERQD